ncbi:Crp/Fnr family transcriptional regulator [Flavobacterium nitrogenifigens]|uniref:cAMP-binding domain of CRP or a regulatory subunit of cAMP-dependent protein kinases n=1 Tax=Flavobacterium nitrogenifigens TaxID=1617283 RepID=A0A521BAW0_9FLAO|nr:Crp/Fnr family transcriptional regulator [Flavobacterium nitrogenifigens]KAF2335232.1 Crp/Fnr family transcriptional regulator [Flavobacterium nitrogenifigens]SMO44227.1 cAMP-binding domain of CRP or a regulatory subunit of cAMP-dependent protein kinases [Flavobacterium nitrogenifigens]
MKKNRLLDLVREITTIDDSDFQIIENLFESVHCEKGELLEVENKSIKYLYFINSGFIRIFYNEDGNQITTHINCPSGFITSFNSFINGTISTDNIECITSCEVLRITKNNLDVLCQKSQKWADFARITYEQSVIYNEQRTKDIINLSAEERYLKLLKYNPDLIKNVPLQYIASFIGIKPESLSRIRKKLIS